MNSPAPRLRTVENPGPVEDSRIDSGWAREEIGEGKEREEGEGKGGGKWGREGVKREGKGAR
jgi:hypothetical protein